MIGICLGKHDFLKLACVNKKETEASSHVTKRDPLFQIWFYPVTEVT